MNSKTVKGMKCFLFLSALLAFTLPAQGASFDCGKAQTKVEHLICDNPEISKLDEELSTAYKTALQDEKQADSVKQAQKLWMKERNGCAVAVCVKSAYQARLSLLKSPSPAKLPAFLPKISNGYELLVGKGVEVCEEYEKNLNSFPPNPLWRKIDPASKEFRKPVWSSMSIGEEILFKIDDFVWQRDANPAYYVNRTYWRGTTKEYIKAEKAFKEDSGRVYWAREISKVDIDNDGIPENVVAANFGGGGKILLVVNDDLSEIDYAKTKLLMRHPGREKMGILRPYAAGEWKLPPSIGSQENTLIDDSLHAAYYGVFTYKGKNYFDLWWDAPIIEAKDDHPSGLESQVNRLRVFYAEKNDVKEVCAYRLMK